MRTFLLWGQFVGFFTLFKTTVKLPSLHLLSLVEFGTKWLVGEDITGRGVLAVPQLLQSFHNISGFMGGSMLEYVGSVQPVTLHHLLVVPM